MIKVKYLNIKYIYIYFKGMINYIHYQLALKPLTNCCF